LITQALLVAVRRRRRIGIGLRERAAGAQAQHRDTCQDHLFRQVLQYRRAAGKRGGTAAYLGIAPQSGHGLLVGVACQDR
jgi:hypothetical protein